MAIGYYRAICLGPLSMTSQSNQTPMESVRTINLHQFGDGLLVEVIGEGADEEIHVRSFELDMVDPEQRAVQPRSPLPSGEDALIKKRLASQGYRMVTNGTKSNGAAPSADAMTYPP